jgi:hypothetical protein
MASRNSSGQECRTGVTWYNRDSQVAIESEGGSIMPEELQGYTHSVPESPGAGPPPTFSEFLRRKGEEYRVRDRHGQRSEWLAAINGLYDQIRGWLREDDPEAFLDIVPYQVSRTEPILGTYDAPALQIRFGPAEVNLQPVGRFVPFLTIRGARRAAEPPTEFVGRVDLSDGLRGYNLYRERRPEGDRWQFLDKSDRFTCLNRQEFERVLQELLS